MMEDPSPGGGRPRPVTRNRSDTVVPNSSNRRSSLKRSDSGTSAGSRERSLHARGRDSRPPLASDPGDYSRDIQDLRENLQRKASVYNASVYGRTPQAWSGGEQQQQQQQQRDGTGAGGGVQMQVPTDRRLLMASLDHDAVEDAAEAVRNIVVRSAMLLPMIMFPHTVS